MISEAQRKNIVAVTGASEVNLGTGQIAPGTGMRGPWDPWSAKVMILAGWSGSDRGWLWLACRDCGWFLGFERQYGAAELADVARQHAERCLVQS